MQDILHLVDLTEEATLAYLGFARDFSARLVALGINPADITDEQAYMDDNGGLVVYVDLPDGHGRLEFTVPPSDWAWHNRN